MGTRCSAKDVLDCGMRGSIHAKYPVLDVPNDARILLQNKVIRNGCFGKLKGHNYIAEHLVASQFVWHPAASGA